MPRPRFQIHLSTAFLLMLIAGGLLLLNTQRCVVALAPGNLDWYSDEYGWPVHFLRLDNSADFGPTDELRNKTLLADIVVWLVMLYGTYLFSEWRIRRAKGASDLQP